MKKGDSFGEQALYYNTFRSCSVIAEEEVICLSLGRDICTKVLGEQIQLITYKNMIRWFCEKSKYFIEFETKNIDTMIEKMEIMKNQEKKLIYQINKENKENKVVIFIIEGAVEKVLKKFFFK